MSETNKHLEGLAKKLLIAENSYYMGITPAYFEKKYFDGNIPEFYFQLAEICFESRRKALEGIFGND